MKSIRKKLLVIDDDTDICFLLQQFLRSKDFEVAIAYSGKSGLDALKKNPPNVVLCDFRLPDIDGFEMLQKIHEFDSSISVIMITGYSDVKLAVKAIKMGAYEYVTKPLYPEEILHTIKQSLGQTAASKGPEPKTSAREALAKELKKYVDGKSPGAVQMQNLIGLVAPTNMTCLLIGESGSGKEYVAQKLHEQSNRQDEPFIAVDCGALSNEISASELFGHVKGAFTGAHSTKKGHFEEANGGTLFLDEVGNLSYDNQVKLLRVLQERMVTRIGESKSRKIDIRLIAATNADLEEEVRAGTFREDLFHRLNEFRIDIKPLRQKKEDIELFATHFMHQANEDLNRSVTSISPAALEKLKSHSWPGNLRELQNVIKRAVLMAQDSVLHDSNLPTELGNDFDTKGMEHWTPADSVNLKKVVEETERRVIRHALKMSNFNKSKTAELLGIDRKTLYNKLAQYQLNNLLQDEITL